MLFFDEDFLSVNWETMKPCFDFKKVLEGYPGMFIKELPKVVLLFLV
jgi:hypothetical protein